MGARGISESVCMSAKEGTYTSLLTRITSARLSTSPTRGCSQKSASTTIILPLLSPQRRKRASASTTCLRASEEAWTMFSNPQASHPVLYKGEVSDGGRANGGGGRGLRESSLNDTVADSRAEVDKDGVGTEAGSLEAARGERPKISRAQDQGRHR